VKRVKGFNKARKLLNRENFWESFTTPPRLAAQIKQVFGEELSVQEVVDRIIGEVRDKGDKALLDYTEKLDGVRLDSLEVDRREVVAAYDAIDKKLVSALEFAAGRIRDFHVACGHKAGLIPVDKHLRQQILPLQRVGLYVPGGTAAYPSTVLMMAIPAKVAGVGEIIVQTGKTLKQQKLKIIDVLFRSSACIIANKNSLSSSAKKEKMEFLKRKLRAGLR